MHHKTTSMCLRCVLNGVSLVADIFSSHVEDHGWTATVLNSCVPSKLNQVGVGQNVRDVVTCPRDLFDLLHSEV